MGINLTEFDRRLTKKKNHRRNTAKEKLAEDLAASNCRPTLRASKIIKNILEKTESHNDLLSDIVGKK